MHYDIISAFIKSMRGSDPDAAVYWLARMIDAGEDPKFIARRIMIQASEDIGNADPTALLVAEAAFKAAEVIGYPECRINLAQAAIYNALAPKSNAAEAAIDAALADVRTSGQREVPSYLREMCIRDRTWTWEMPSFSAISICVMPLRKRISMTSRSLGEKLASASSMMIRSSVNARSESSVA